MQTDPTESSRSRRWIVDAYNVLRVSLSPTAPDGPGRWWSEERRAALATLAAGLPHPEDEVFLVFDGRHLSEPQVLPPADPGRPAVRRVYAPSADAWILSALAGRDAGHAPPAVVVTADRSLGDRARHRGACVMATDAFVALCRGDSPQAP